MPRLREFCHFPHSIFGNTHTFLLSIFLFTFGLSFSEAKDNFKRVERRKALTIVEYFDFSCPLSAQSSKSLASFKDKMGSRVRILRRSLAFSDEGFSWIAGKYYHSLLNKNKKLAESFYKRVFEQTLKGEINEAFLKNVITDLGLDFTKFELESKSPFFGKRAKAT